MKERYQNKIDNMVALILAIGRELELKKNPEPEKKKADPKVKIHYDW